MIALEDRNYTVEEYFAILKKSDLKLEYHDGKIYPKGGGTSNHNAISVNTTTILGNILSEKNCIVYNSGQQVFIEPNNRYLFPDVSVVCGKQEFEDEKETKLKNPILLVEVSSPSIDKFDKIFKLSLYNKLPSFKEYLLISSYRIGVMSYYKEDNDLWRISSAIYLEEKIHLYSLNIDISVADIYKKIKGLKSGLEK